MYRLHGSARRRRLILAEIIVGVVAMIGIGAWVLASAVDIGGRALGAWLIGAGLDYLPLTAYAFVLSRPGALDIELAGVDAGCDLRRYGLLVPLPQKPMVAVRARTKP
jgi:hypothetical protein